MRTEEESQLIRKEIGDAVLAVLEQGKIVSVEAIVTQLEINQRSAIHQERGEIIRKAVELLIQKA